MGPRPDGRGKPGTGREEAGRAKTSMGPRPDGRGKHSWPSWPRQRPSYFNGAAAGWPRKAAAPSARRWRSTNFNGAAAGWPRKDVGVSAVLYQPVYFNGAAAGWPRKAAHSAPEAAWPVNFNGAAAGWPRKVEMQREILAHNHELQWGRGRMAAESGLRLGTDPSETKTSMGPRPDGRGKAFVRWAGAFLAELLQWGRGRMAAERCAACVSFGRHAHFNGAAAGWPRKVGTALLTQDVAFTSMGPRPDGRGKPCSPRKRR